MPLVLLLTGMVENLRLVKQLVDQPMVAFQRLLLEAVPAVDDLADAATCAAVAAACVASAICKRAA